jgi:5'-AMP-activated protein kinase catalytic alpha subunit
MIEIEEPVSTVASKVSEKRKVPSKNRETSSDNAYSRRASSQSKNIGHFILKEKLGEGTFGKVRLGTHILTGEKVAVKILEKNKILGQDDKTRVEREIKILKCLRHPNIIQLYSVIQTVSTIYLIMEYAPGGELFDYIVNKKKLSELEACKFYQQIISGIDYLHKLRIAHRDLKPENLLLDHKKDLKIVDFGLSNTYNKGEYLRTACGSPCYAAPETIANKPYSGVMVDIWSSGIILYAMLCGYLPFEDRDNEVLYRKIGEGKFTLPNTLSDGAKDLIRRILNTDPSKRYNIQQIRTHPWFNSLNHGVNTFEGLLININVIPIDESLVLKMEEYDFKRDEVRTNILSNRHNHITTTYYLLLKNKIRKGGSSIADLVSDSFKNYLLDDNNLIQKYNNDFNNVIQERAFSKKKIRDNIEEEELTNSEKNKNILTDSNNTLSNVINQASSVNTKNITTETNNNSLNIHSEKNIIKELKFENIIPVETVRVNTISKNSLTNDTESMKDVKNVIVNLDPASVLTLDQNNLNNNGQTDENDRSLIRSRNNSIKKSEAIYDNQTSSNNNSQLTTPIKEKTKVSIIPKSDRKPKVPINDKKKTALNTPHQSTKTNPNAYLNTEAVDKFHKEIHSHSPNLWSKNENYKKIKNDYNSHNQNTTEGALNKPNINNPSKSISPNQTKQIPLKLNKRANKNFINTSMSFEQDMKNTTLDQDNLSMAEKAGLKERKFLIDKKIHKPFQSERGVKDFSSNNSTLINYGVAMTESNQDKKREFDVIKEEEEFAKKESNKLNFSPYKVVRPFLNLTNYQKNINLSHNLNSNLTQTKQPFTSRNTHITTEMSVFPTNTNLSTIIENNLSVSLKNKIDYQSNKAKSNNAKHYKTISEPNVENLLKIDEKVPINNNKITSKNIKTKSPITATSNTNSNVSHHKKTASMGSHISHLSHVGNTSNTSNFNSSTHKTKQNSVQINHIKMNVKAMNNTINDYNGNKIPLRTDANDKTDKQNFVGTINNFFNQERIPTETKELISLNAHVGITSNIRRGSLGHKNSLSMNEGRLLNLFFRHLYFKRTL